MEIRFRTRKLEKRYRQHREAEKAYGKDVARKFIQRVNIIRNAKDMEELRRLPGLRCHKLKGPRKDQWGGKVDRFLQAYFHS